MRSGFELPCRLGGLGLINPRTLCAQVASSNPHHRVPHRQDFGWREDPRKCFDLISTAKADAKAATRRAQIAGRGAVMSNSSGALLKSIDVAREKGSSNWLTCHPIGKYGFSLSKQEVGNGLGPRLGWAAAMLPSHGCCGHEVNVTHSLSCSHGGLPSIKRNTIRDTTAYLLDYLCSNISIEPVLQPLTGEQLRYRTANVESHARLVVAACGLWGSQFERTLLDVRVFNPYARSN